MGRIRTIKPEFFTDEELSALPADTHLFAAGLLCYADDEGYFNANPGLLKGSIFPLRECKGTVDDMLAQLEGVGYIALGNADGGKRYGRVVKFNTHQRVNRPSPSKYGGLSICWGDSLNSHGALTENSLPEGKGREGNSEGKGTVCLPTNRPKPSGITIDPHMMTRGLCERLGLSRQMGQGSVYMAVCDIAQVEEVRGGDLENLCDRMAEAYQMWMQEEMKYRWGAAKFFGDGWWNKPETWPRKNDNSPPDKAARREQKWEEFEAKENDNEIE